MCCVVTHDRRIGSNQKLVPFLGTETVLAESSSTRIKYFGEPSDPVIGDLQVIFLPIFAKKMRKNGVFDSKQS
jgi:hypothetical protein